MATALSRTRGWKKQFLENLALTGNISEAARVARVHRQTVYEHRWKDETFAAAWDNAIEEAVDRMEREAVRRGVEGVEKPVYQGGRLVGHVLEFSDQMLSLLLKSHRPEKYRETVRQEHTGKDGEAIKVDSYESLTSRIDSIAARIRETAGPPGANGRSNGHGDSEA